MLLEALDAAFDNLVQADIDLSKLRAIKADAMQHCTVYTHDRFVKMLKSLIKEVTLFILVSAFQLYKVTIIQ